MSIETARPDGKTGRVIPQVHFGVIGSGQKVVSNPEFIKELKGAWPELIGVEMEAVGVALAAYSSEQAPGFLVVKGISDWADPSKNDGWQAYASEAFVASLLESEPFQARTRTQAIPHGQQANYPGEVKIAVCRKLFNDWEELADFFEIPEHQRRRFGNGREPAGVWEWLADRGKLGFLTSALKFVGRDDLAEELSSRPI